MIQEGIKHMYLGTTIPLFYPNIKNKKKNSLVKYDGNMAVPKVFCRG